MLRTVPFVYPRTSPADLTQRPLSQKYGKEEARKSRNGGNGPGYRTQYFSPLSDGVASSPYWALMNSCTAFVKVFQVYRVQLWLRGRSPTPGRRGDIGPHADARAAAWRRARTSGAHGCCPGFGTLRAVACRTRDARRRHVFRRDARCEGEYPRTHAATRCSLESLVDISPQLEHDGKH